MATAQATPNSAFTRDTEGFRCFRAISASGGIYSCIWIRLKLNNVEPLVSEEIWWQVRKIKERNKALARASRKHQYILTAHIWGGTCGSRMNGHPGFWKSKNQSGYNLYYRCAGRDGERANIVCHLPQFRVEQVDEVVWQWITDLLTNPQLLEQGMTDYIAEQGIKNERYIERIQIIDELLLDQREQLNRILDLYVDGNFPKDILIDKKTRLEQTIRSLEKEKVDLTDFMERKSLTPEQYQDIQEFSRKITDSIDLATTDFETKRQIVDLLDIQVVCSLDDESNKLVKLTCILGSDHYELTPGTHAHNGDG